MQLETDLKKHAARRPPWDKALSARSMFQTLKELPRLTNCLDSITYYPRMDHLLDLLVERIKGNTSQGKPVPINHWITCFTFDMMGELAYNKSYGCLETGVIHQGILDMGTAFATLVVVSYIPWLIRIISSIIGEPKHMQGYVNFAKQALAERKPDGETPDVLSYVLDGKVELTPEELVEDTMMVQIAGSDTTNSALVFCIFRLASCLDVQAALREEILKSAGITVDELPIKLTWEMIKDLPLLGAVIDETLRLHPPCS